MRFLADPKHASCLKGVRKSVIEEAAPVKKVKKPAKNAKQSAAPAPRKKGRKPGMGGRKHG